MSSNDIKSTDIKGPSNSNSSPSVDEKSIKLENKRKDFDRELKSLIKQSQETITARHGISIELGNIRPELVCLNKYLSIYNIMEPHEHFQYFETLYNRKRPEILNCLEDDRWIRTGNIYIQFGDGIRATKDIEEKRKQVRIMLTDIYLIACDLRAQAEKSLDGLDGLDESVAQSAGGKDLIRPNILLLHLIRIFYYLNDGHDKEKLGTIVTHLENELGVTRKTVNEESFKTASQAAINSPAASGGLSGLFTMATSMMEKMGYKPPPGMKPPSESEISTVIGSVFNNEVTQNAIQGMVSSLQGCQDFGTAIQEVVKNVTDPKTMGAIQESVAQTAQMASFTGIQPTAPTPEQQQQQQ